MADRFAICLPFTLAQECPLPNDWSNPRNFSDDAHDPGGKTMCGIIQREYDLYRKAKGLDTQDVRLISEDEGDDIFDEHYWMPYCPRLPIGMDMQFFDAAVNMGTTEAVKILQYSLGINNDGLWGQQTNDAVAAISDVPQAVNKFTTRRMAVYRQMKGFPYFGRDWINRADQIGATALKMAAGA